MSSSMADSKPVRRRSHDTTTITTAFPNLELVRQDATTVPAASALKGKRYVLFYFAAHYLPSCQRFTPQLADFYNENAAKHNLEVVFISDDRSEAKMMEFFQNRCSNYVFRHNKVVQPSPKAERDEPHHEALARESAGPDSLRLRQRLRPDEPLEVVTTTTTTTMSYNSTPGRTTTSAAATAGGSAKPHASDDEDDANDGSAAPITHTTQKTSTSRTTAQEALQLLEQQEKQQGLTGASTDSANMTPLPGHKPRLSAMKGYAPREPIASGHAQWLALRYADGNGAVGKWLRRRYKVSSAPRLVVVDGETGRMLVSEGKTMLLRDPLGEAFPWPGADLLIQAERKASARPYELMRYPFLCLSIIMLALIGVYALARQLM